MVRSQAIKLIGVDDRFEETGHVIVDNQIPELVMFNGDPFIAVERTDLAPHPTIAREYRKVRPYRFVRKALP